MTVDPEYTDLLRQYHQAPTPQLAQLLHDRYMHLRASGVFGGSTTNGLPFPDPADPVAGGADAIRALAEAIEPRLPVGIAVGVVTFPETAVNARSTVEVTFPTGTFAQRPSVQITASSGAPEWRPVSVNNPSPTSFTAVYTNQSTASGILGAYWMAMTAPNSSTMLLAADSPTDDTVTCTQDGCGNVGIPIPVHTTYLDDDGTAKPVTAFQCGACGTTLIPEGA